MNEAILMSASADNIDFMIHGLFSFQLFGQEVWITTSHVCIAIVMLVLVIFSIVANRKIAHATEVPDTFQNVLELMVEKLSGIVENNMGSHAPKFTNYICTIFVFIFRTVWTQSANRGLWNHICPWYHYVCTDSHHKMETPVLQEDLG